MDCVTAEVAARLVTSRENVSLQLQNKEDLYRGPFRRHLIEGSVTGLGCSYSSQGLVLISASIHEASTYRGPVLGSSSLNMLSG